MAKENEMFLLSVGPTTMGRDGPIVTIGAMRDFSLCQNRRIERTESGGFRQTGEIEKTLSIAELWLDGHALVDALMDDPAPTVVDLQNYREDPHDLIISLVRFREDPHALIISLVRLNPDWGLREALDAWCGPNDLERLTMYEDAHYLEDVLLREASNLVARPDNILVTIGVGGAYSATFVIPKRIRHEG